MSIGSMQGRIAPAIGTGASFGDSSSGDLSFGDLSFGDLGAGAIGVSAIWTLAKMVHPVLGGLRSAIAAARVAELACNLSDRRETDLRPAEGLPDRSQSLAAGLAVRPVWYYLLATAFLLSCWECLLYQRRWID